MNLKDITTKCFIMALIIRDDGERLLLGSGRYEFKEDQKHFAANTFSNDVVDVQGNDGVFLAGQVRRAATQVFDGFVGDATTSKSDVEKWRTDFLRFFRKEHFYKVIYIFPDGTSIQRRQGFIVDAPEVPEFYQMFPEYHIGLNFEDVNYYTYAEDDDGAEKYARLVELMPYTPATGGGLVWDETGAVWDETGAVWSAGGGAQENIVNVDSIDLVQPIWHVVGPCTNPSVTVLTTGTTLTFNGTVAEGQELVVDNFRQTAMLSGTSVIESMSGDWLLLAPGANRVVYNVTLMPSTNPTIDDLTYMQDFAKYDSAGIQSIVASMVEEQVYTLKDSRDQQDYKISKLKSGQVLMAEDLRIQNYKCTPEDTDITEGVFQIPASTPGNYPSGSTAETIALRVEEDTAYYSWAAATAGCKPADGDAKISIMPKGWTLPTRNDWLKLLQSYPTKENIMAEPVPSIKAVSYWDGNGINQAFKDSVYRWASTISETQNPGWPDFLIAGDSAPYVRGQNPIGNGFAIRGILKAGGGDMRPLIEVLKYMQDVAFCDFDELAASMELEKVYTLIDKRDNKSYGIALLKDGNIWMVDDLKLGDGKEMELTPEDTDIPEDWTLPASYELSSSHKWPTDQHNAYWHKGTLTYYYNFNCAVAMNELPGYTPKNYWPDQSILPKGWKLPGETEVNDLWNAYVKDNDATTLFGVPKFTNAGQIDAGYTATPTNPKVAYYNAARYDVYDRGGGVNELWSYTYYASTDNSTKGKGTWWSYIGRAVRGVVRKREEGGME